MIEKDNVLSICWDEGATDDRVASQGDRRTARGLLS